MGFRSPYGDDDAVLEAWIRDVNQHNDQETSLLDSPCGYEAPHGTIVSRQRYLSDASCWQLRNREFAVGRYQVSPGQMPDGRSFKDLVRGVRQRHYPQLQNSIAPRGRQTNPLPDQNHPGQMRALPIPASLDNGHR